MKLYMFWTVPLSIVRSLFTVHSAVVYVIQLSSRIRMELYPSARLSGSLNYETQIKEFLL